MPRASSTGSATGLRSQGERDPHRSARDEQGGRQVCRGALAVAPPPGGGPCPAVVFVVVLTLAVATTSPFQAVLFTLEVALLRTLALVVDDPT